MELMHGIGSIQYFTKEFMATQRVINVYLYLVRMQSCRKKEEEKKKFTSASSIISQYSPDADYYQTERPSILPSIPSSPSHKINMSKFNGKIMIRDQCTCHRVSQSTRSRSRSTISTTFPAEVRERRDLQHRYVRRTCVRTAGKIIMKTRRNGGE